MTHVKAKPRRQVGSYSRKPAQFPALIESPMYGPLTGNPFPSANREAVGYHRKITCAEAHTYIRRGAARFTPRVWETRIAERRCSFLVVTLLRRGIGEQGTKGRSN
ncbi:Uncharacterized protein DBV15_01826 [Temnothorax longispinosus]|uniref:Uncharacterized protein n=1 Tax=Temnothorax longispinosus TaxID=300112 RepID=A0A4S2L0M2_9HYME|nr:Uncharacterized protein DBV15_01826 [Temnothorax longispinosus]